MVRHTRQQRIVATAGRRPQHDGTGTVTTDAGTTGGAFHSHFASNNDLTAPAIADQPHTPDVAVGVQVQPDPAGLEQFVRWYLSAHHRDDPGDGCPNVALLDEIGRGPRPTGHACTDGVLAFVDGLAARMTPDDPLSARAKAISLLGLMVGTLQLCRALTDRQLSDDLLEQGLRNALTLLDTEHRG
jgi:TetR/AcrR family transcriptional regulator, transcriptional repressor for nem operon